MRFVDEGFLVVLAGLLLALIAASLWFLNVWEYVHDKLRAERKEDELEQRQPETADDEPERR